MKEKVKKIECIQSDSLLNILINNIRELSKKKLKSIVKYKMVYVDDKCITKHNEIIKVGSIIKVYFTPRVTQNSDLNILYEDDGLIVIDKPAGLLTISNSKEKYNTAFRMVSDYIKNKDKKTKIFVVHRLDQATSGVLLFSKNLKLKEEMQKKWNDIVKLREYIAVVEGKTLESGKIESYLTMNHFQIVHSTKDKEKGWYAVTKYKRLRFNKSFSLLEVNIETGRRNQIRVHMSEMDHPILGDKKYGSKYNPINRLALHASKLHIIDLRTGKLIKFESKAPDDINNLV